MAAIWPGALLVVYLVATGTLLIGSATAWSAAVAMHFGLLAVVLAGSLSPRVPSWIRDWLPVIVLLPLYTEMPALIAAAGHAGAFDPMVMRWEQAVFGFQPSIEWAVRWPTFAVSEALHAAYLSYYGIIVSVPLALYLRCRSEAFSEAMFVLTFTFVVCFSAYIVFPVAGPRYLFAPPSGVPAGPVRRLTIWLLEARSSQGTAFPSSHVAVAVVQSVLAIRYFGRKGSAVAVITVGLAAGAVYGGFHYGVDVLAGTGLGLLASAAALGLYKRLSGIRALEAKASAPT